MIAMHEHAFRPSLPLNVYRNPSLRSETPPYDQQKVIEVHLSLLYNCLYIHFIVDRPKFLSCFSIH